MSRHALSYTTTHTLLDQIGAGQTDMKIPGSLTCRHPLAVRLALLGGNGQAGNESISSPWPMHVGWKCKVFW
nr:hypothetical protein CFP56_11769 [Quercus suber]